MELLLVLAIIGFIAQIVIFSLGVITEGAIDQRDKRNAQEIAGLAAAASAAGAKFVVPGDEVATLANLREGRAPNSGPFRGRLFQLSSVVGPSELQGAMRFLELRNEELCLNGQL